MSIHPLAAVHPDARLGQNVTIGPFCVVEAGVAIGDGCILYSHAIVKSGTTLGPNNQIFEAAVVGGLPQHIRMPEHPGGLIIGSGNTIRENATIHRSLEKEDDTIIGNDNLLMSNVHVAHDCIIGSNVIVTTNSMLAGHVIVGDKAYLSGAVAIHQFCRIGSLAIVGGQAHIVQDVPPYVTIDGLSSYVVGLNRIGLRRAGYQIDDVKQLKAAYRLIYRSGLAWKDILAQLEAEFSEGPAALFHDFLASTKRGIITERRMPPHARTIKLPSSDPSSQEEPQVRVRVG